MKSPLQRVLVFDLETGGLNWKTNPITEMAGVVIELETLEIIEEFSVVFKPQFDLTYKLEEAHKEAKRLFGELAQPDEETKVKSLLYKGGLITLKSLTVLIEDIEAFDTYLADRIAAKKKLKQNGNFFTWEDYQELLQGDYSDIVKVYFDASYNPQALAVTHMSIDLLLNEGVSHDDAANQIKELIARHTVGSNKPIIAGHNIKSFDLPFMEKLFSDYGLDWYKLLNSFQIDTLEWVRMRWSELSSFSLGVCANELGLTLKDAHRALPDTVANARLLIKLLQSFRGEGTSEKKYERKKYDFNY